MPIFFSNFGLSKEPIPPKNKKKNNAKPIWNFEYPCAFHKNGSNIEQDVVISDYSIAIIFRIFNFLFDKISTNACFNLKSDLGCSVFENLGTLENIKRAHIIPKIARKGILLSPKYCAIVEDSRGPNE